MASSYLPHNVHVSHHPCLRAKLSQLRSHTTNPKETKALVHEISLIVACEALAHGLKNTPSGTNESPLGYDYTTETIAPSSITLVPILRSGLGMLEGTHPSIASLPFLTPRNSHHQLTFSPHLLPALQTLLPFPVSVHHLGLFREDVTLQPVEYYNNLPQSRPSTSSSQNTAAAELAILLDPVIATGGTSSAAIQTLREWGAKRVMLICVLGSEGGVRRASEEWTEGVELWVGGMDKECDDRGMIKPGLGDVGDRLFLTLGK